MAERETPQLPLFSRPLGEQARDTAILRVDVNNPTLVGLALGAIRALLADGVLELTTDDVWRRLGDTVAGEPRAMGAAMRRAQAEGLIRPTARHVCSLRVACHRRPLRVWEVASRR